MTVSTQPLSSRLHRPRPAALADDGRRALQGESVVLAAVFAVALAFYWTTLAPTLIWGDSTWFTLYAKLGMWSFTTAGDHPLFVALGRLFVMLPGDAGRNLAIESALFGAAAVALAYRITRQLGGARLSAMVGAGALCVSHAFWFHAVIPEVYTANTFFLLATISLVLDWRLRSHPIWLCAAGAMFAVGLTNHLVLGTCAPALMAFVAVTNPKLVSGRVAAGMAAIAVLAALPVMILWNEPLSRAAYRLWVGPPGISDYFSFDMPLGAILREAGYYLLYLAYQFPSITLVLGAIGAARLAVRDRAAAVLLLGTAAVNAGLFIHHAGWESASSMKFVFYIADYAIYAVLCGLGAEAVLDRVGARVWQRRAAAVAFAALTVAVPPVLYATVPVMTKDLGVELIHAKTLPYRDNQTYFLNPSKRGYDGARRFGEEVLRSAPPSAVIFADYTPFSVLRYLQLVERRRRDLTLRFPPEAGQRVPVSWTFDGEKRRPTFIASTSLEYYDFSAIEGEYELHAAGLLTEVRPRD